MNNYFDLHIHPLAKNHLALKPKETSEKNRIEDLVGPVSMSKDFKDYTNETVLRKLESQSCIDYLNEGMVRFGVASVSALQFGMASSKGFFTDILKSGLKKPIAEQYFEMVKEGKVSYLNLLLKEIQQYIDLKEKCDIKYLNRGNAHELNESVLNLVFAIGGGHNLCMKKIGNALEYDKFENFTKGDFYDPGTIPSKSPADVLESLVDKMREKKLEVLYLTLAQLTHIPEQHLATHAFGTKSMKHPSFYPFGNGLTELGKEVVKRASTLQIEVEENDSKTPNNKKGEDGVAKQSAPVFIDVTHLSLKSREDLYEFRRKEGFEKIPLIASHIGVTGYSINGWKHNLEVEKCKNHVDQGIKTIKTYTRPKEAGYWGANDKKGFNFNPNTINLMDEDIIEIANSGGLIGVGLDVDILGYDSNFMDEKDNCEFLTTPDFIHFFPYKSIRLLEYATAEEIRAQESWLEPNRRELHPLSLCFNIVHILAVIGLKTAHKDSAEEYICIGSDFDGFIEPLRVCSDSRNLKNLEACLMKWLPVAAKEYQKVNGGTNDLFEFTKKKKDLEKVVRKILYINGSKFLGDNFSRIISSNDAPNVELVD